jgi:hypothetical protein
MPAVGGHAARAVRAEAARTCDPSCAAYAENLAAARDAVQAR